MIYPFHSIWHLSSWFPVGTCSLCGQANAESKRVEVIDGSPYVFDTYSCDLRNFNFMEKASCVLLAVSNYVI